MSRTLFVALGALATVLASAGSARAQDPTQPGPFAVSNQDYDLGDSRPLECDPGIVGQQCNTESDCDGTFCQVTCRPTEADPSRSECQVDSGKTEVRARVYYPTLSQLGAGQALPLILFVHGQHAPCYNPNTGETADPAAGTQWPCGVDSHGQATSPVPNYRGYDYIASILASHGYIVASLSLDALNSVQFGGEFIEERAVLIDQHLRMWKTFNEGTGLPPEPFHSQFTGHVDLQRVGTMGHSRGGDAVVMHYGNFATQPSSPYKVRAVMPIAPISNSAPITGVPLGLLMSYCDGNVADLRGLKFYDHSRHALAGDPAPKHVFLARGGNHAYFNTAWTEQCWDSPPGSPTQCPLWDANFNHKPCASGDADCTDSLDDWRVFEISNNREPDPFCSEGPNSQRLTPAQQRGVAVAYTAAFFRYYIGQETAFGPILRGDANPPIAAGNQMFVSYQPPASRRRDVDYFETDEDLLYSTLTGQACSVNADCGAAGQCIGSVCVGNVQSVLVPGPELCTDCYTESPEALREAHSNHGEPLSRTHLRWSASGQTLTVQIPPGARNVSAFDTLQFRVGVDYLSAAPQTSPLRFTLVLHSGNAQAVASSDSQLGNNDLWKAPLGYSRMSVLSTLRLPYSAFTTTAGFDFANVTDVTFAFDQQASAGIFVSDLQFATDATCTDGMQNQGEAGVDCGGPCPNACTCTPTTYQAETMFHSTGNAVTDGWNIFSNGYIATNHTFGAGASSLTVTARGQSAGGVAAHMVVSVGGSVVGSVFVTSASFAPFTFDFMTTAGTKEIRVAFDNDFFQPPQDRNLYVDKVVVACQSGSGCTEATAVDLGGQGNNVSVPVGGCVRVKNAYPPWWTTRPMKLENPGSGSYPVPFTWTNTCSNSSGSGTFTANWQAPILTTTSSACATLIDLLGTGAGNITLRYWSN